MWVSTIPTDILKISNFFFAACFEQHCTHHHQSSDGNNKKNKQFYSSRIQFNFLSSSRLDDWGGGGALASLLLLILAAASRRFCRAFSAAIMWSFGGTVVRITNNIVSNSMAKTINPNPITECCRKFELLSIFQVTAHGEIKNNNQKLTYVLFVVIAVPAACPNK